MSKKTSKTIIFIAMLALLILWITPIFLVIINSLKDYQEVVNSKASLPTEPISQGITNFQAIMANDNLSFASSFMNSIIITSL